jgi:hypothetical protein
MEMAMNTLSDFSAKELRALNISLQTDANQQAGSMSKHQCLVGSYNRALEPSISELDVYQLTHRQSDIMAIVLRESKR